MPSLRSLLRSGVVLGWIAISVPSAWAGDIAILASGLTGCDFVTGKLSAACIPTFIGHVIKVVVSLISILFVLNVLYAGYQLAMGSVSGDKSAGKDRLIWSVLGLIISLCSFLILDVVLSVLLG